ncbi:tetratricopeptide repeat protein [Candidatus Sumerlaeota bacterium]|nr:tetratricopeptide repeat protein [Candidatus Sumerlaeota bacterium]
MINAVPIVSFALLALWTWAVCRILMREQSHFWLAMVIFLPPVGIPVYLINFFLLGDERYGLTAMKRRSAARQREAYLRMILSDGEVIGHRLELAEIALERQDYSGALTEIQQVLTRDPEDLQAHFLAARTFVASGKPEQALAHLDFIYSENNSFASYSAATLYAVTLQNLGRHEEASRVFETLLNHHAIPEVLFHYALHLRHLGRHEEAWKLLERLVTEYRKDSLYFARRDDPWLRRAKRALRG